MTARHSALIITTIALILLALVPAASAEIIINESLIDYSDTSLPPSNALTDWPGADLSERKPFKYLAFKNIERQENLGYVIIESTTRKLGYSSEGQLLPTGRHNITYKLDGATKPGVIYISRSYDMLGNHLKSRIQFFLNEWDNTGLSGTKYVELSIIIDTAKIAAHQRNSARLYPDVTLAWYGFYSSDYPLGYYPVADYNKYTVSMASATEWKTDITVDKIDDYAIGYEIYIARTVDDKPYQTTVKFYNNETLVFGSSALGTTIQEWYPIDGITHIQIINPMSKTYTFTLTGAGEPDNGDDDPDDPGDPSRVMVHIIAQDARNENLLLDAAVEVRDQYDAVVAAGTTSPEGWMVFEYDLPDTLTDEDFDRYYTVSVSLPGWTQKVTNFKFYPAFIPRSGDWIRVEMLPDTDGPADPEKTYIMFFVRDIHANPLERASIEIAGQYWHTNSAGHVAVEVPKNSTTAYTVRKTGHVSISGSAAVGAEGSYVVNIALGPALPDRTPGPGDDPGATPPPRDTRTNEEKGKAVIDLIADNAELIATLAILAAVMGLINLIMPGRRRR